ncbi:MAG: class I SAM-dependent methyltransferase, partial [Deltaproteobacteria bacterium]
VGTGPGYICRELAKRVSEVKIVGLEISSLMLKAARKNIDEAGLSGRILLQAGNAERMPFKSKSFDGVISNSSLHHWQEPVAVFNEIRRVLKDGGRFLICDLRRDAPGIPVAMIYLLLSDRNREGFLNSVKAAYTLKECEQLLAKSELENFQVLNLFMNLIVIPRDF